MFGFSTYPDNECKKKIVSASSKLRQNCNMIERNAKEMVELDEKLARQEELRDQYKANLEELSYWDKEVKKLETEVKAEKKKRKRANAKLQKLQSSVQYAQSVDDLSPLNPITMVQFYRGKLSGLSPLEEALQHAEASGDEDLFEF